MAELYDQETDEQFADTSARIQRMQTAIVDCIIELGVLARQLSLLDLADFRRWEQQ